MPMVRVAVHNAQLHPFRCEPLSELGEYRDAVLLEHRLHDAYFGEPLRRSWRRHIGIDPIVLPSAVVTSAH